MAHSTPTSATPTRQTSSEDPSHQHVNYNDFMSPSAYLNDTAFTPSAESHTPYAPHPPHDHGYPVPDSSDSSLWASVAASSASAPGLHHPQPVVSHHSHMNDNLQFEEYGPSSSPTVQDYPSPTGQPEESTPVVSDNQQPTTSSSYPQPPSSSSGGMHAPHVPSEMLASPFQPMTTAQQTEQYAYMQQLQHQQQYHQQPQPAYVNPQDFQHAPVPAQYQFPHAPQQMGNPPFSYNGSPLESTAPGFQPQMTMGMSPAFMPSPVDGSYPYMPQQQQAYAWPNSYGPAQSRGQSPASSASSSAVSLIRSASTSSDLHHKARPKTKLLFKDKADIVRIHKKDSSLRQEDIAKMYG